MESQVIESFCEKDTFEAGRVLGTECTPGDIVLLYGDLGAGKTVFTKGFRSEERRVGNECRL